MTLTDNDLSQILQTLSPRDRKILTDALREGGQLPADARAILRWIKRRLKRKARAGQGPRPEPKRKYRRLRRPGAKTAQKDAITRKKEG